MFNLLAARGAGSPGFIVGPIAKFMGFLYDILFNFIHSFSETGSLFIAIILFTLLVKIVIMPLTYKQLKGTYRMRQLQPELNKIRAKYEGKTDEESQRRLSFELQEFQKENGAGMFAGCLPMLIQLPILYALFYIFRQPYDYVGIVGELYTKLTEGLLAIGAAERVEVLKPIILANNMTVDVAVFEEVSNLVKIMSPANWDSVLAALGNVPAGLAELVAQKNAIEYCFGLGLASNAGWGFPGIIVPILAGVTTYLSSWYMQKKQNSMSGGADEMSENMSKSMNIVMPFMMAFITVSTPVALGIYWTLSNVFSLLQTGIIYKMLEKKEANGTLVYKAKKVKEVEQKSTIVDRNKYTNQKGAGKK